MGTRRMFSKTVIETDNFFDMNTKTQLIYFYLNLGADDDGFIGNIKKQLRTLGGTPKQLDELNQKGYIIIFDTGVAVITHWRVHNTIRKDRYTETVYKDELNQLELDDKSVYRLATKCQPTGDKTGDKSATQVKLSKDKLSQDKKRESIERKKPTPTPRGEMGNVILSEEEYERLYSRYPDIDMLIDRFSVYISSSGKRYASHYATLIRWAEDDKARREAEGGQSHTFSDHTYGAPRTKAPPSVSDSFELDDFFALAVKKGQNLYPTL